MPNLLMAIVFALSFRARLYEFGLTDLRVNGIVAIYLMLVQR